MYKIVLLRHGRSLADDENRFEGRYDTPLTDVGLLQAKETARKFKNSGYIFDAIITSPLLRALKTAEIINLEYQVPLIISDKLVERDNGILAGLERTKADFLYPLSEKNTPLIYFPNRSGENLVLLQARALTALNFILQHNVGNYLIVSHGNFLNALVRVILEIPNPINRSGCLFRFTDNGHMVFDYYEDDHRWIMQRLE